MKKHVMLVLGLVLVLSACAPSFDQHEEVITEGADNNKETAILPKYKISDEYYSMKLPFEPSAARGLVVNNVNTRYDITEFETGLMRVAQNTFNTNTYYFQEGQYLDRSTINAWLQRKSSDEQNQGLNPAQNNDNNAVEPIYLAHMLEHDYLVKSEDSGSVKLGGIAIGLALNSVYTYEEGGVSKQMKIDREKLEREGKKIAAEAITKLRGIDGLERVPIVIALFEQKESSSVVPGSFIAYANASEGSDKLGDWQAINEKYVLFPSSNSDYKQEVDAFNFLKSDIEEYFPNFNGVVGRAFYVNNEMRNLSIEIPIQFYGKTEAIGFTQFVAGALEERFPPNEDVSIQVSITSVYGPEALIVRKAGEKEPFVHMYQ